MTETQQAARLALIGANGMLARKIREQVPEGIELRGYDLPEFDLTSAEQVASELDLFRPDIVVNCAAFTAVDACEERIDEAMAVNGTAVAAVAAYCRDRGVLLIHFSTDYVFDGKATRPYLETDPTGPLSQYGLSKLAGEKAILESGLSRYLIVRTSWLYGPGGNNFAKTILRLAAEREDLGIVADQVGSPTYTGDLATALYHLVEQALWVDNDAVYGIYHVSNNGQCSWYDFAQAIVEGARARGAELSVRTIRPIATEEYPLPAKRPAYSVLDKSRYEALTEHRLPSWQDGLQCYLDEELPVDIAHGQ